VHDANVAVGSLAQGGLVADFVGSQHVGCGRQAIAAEAEAGLAA
jgi:hypothetical protein